MKSVRRVGQLKKNKVYKIKYKLNLLPQIGIHIIKDKDGKNVFYNEKISIMDLCSESNELDVYLSEAVQEIIEYKWAYFARKWYFVGFGFHLFYMTVLFVYIHVIYVQNV